MPHPISSLLQWSRGGHIDQQHLPDALALIQEQPTPPQWQQFITTVLLWGGAIALAVGVIFFFAYNWQSMDRGVKFALAQGAIVVTALIHWRLSSRQALRTPLAMGLALLIGALLALVGQTYQTGADPWQLFAIWALMITPLAIIEGASSLWLLWLVLCNTAMALYLSTFGGFWGLLLDELSTLWVFLGLNIISAIAFEALYQHSLRHRSTQKIPWLSNRLAAQVAILASSALLAWAAVIGLFSTQFQYAIPVYLVLTAATYVVYRFYLTDVVLLSGIILGGIVFIIALLARVFENTLDDGGPLLFIGLAIIGLSSLGAMHLKNIAAHHNTEHSNTQTEQQ